MRHMTVLAALALVGCTPAADTAANEAAAAADRGAMTAAQRAYAEANDRMHSAMGSNIPADADVAFVQGMIPHHQGAIDMARIVLEHGTDPENQALARAVIAAQEAEIAQMRAWLERREMAGVDATGAQPAPAPRENTAQPAPAPRENTAQPAPAPRENTAQPAPDHAAGATVDHSKMGH